MSNSAINETRSMRNYGIDLLRFVSMLMIVGLHVIENGGILDNVQSLTIKGEVIWFLEIACFCSVNCFALVSGYVGYKTQHKWKNLVSLCAQTVFYCVLFTAIYVGVTLYNKETLDLSFALKSLIPQAFTRYWYFSAYFCLYFFMPILDRIIDMPKPFLKRAALVVIFVFCGITQIIDKVSSLSDGYSFLWLAVLYVVGGYFAKYNPWSKLSFGMNVLGYLSCVSVTLASKILIGSMTNSGYSKILISYTSPTILFAALFLLNSFAHLKINEKYRKTVLLFSSASFGVYLIHCQPFVFDKILADLFGNVVNYNVISAVLAIIGITLAIYLLCTAIDYARKYVFKFLGIEKLIEIVSKISTRLFNAIEGTD